MIFKKKIFRLLPMCFCLLIRGRPYPLPAASEPFFSPFFPPFFLRHAQSAACMAL